MKLLVTKAHPTIALLHAARPWLGRLAVPKDSSQLDATAALGITWAADNAAFSDFDEAAYRRMLDRISGVPGCKFVVAPDVVADADATLELWHEWVPILHVRDLPVALALQDGLTVERVPWDGIEAVFVGGTTEWKMGLEALSIVDEAKKRRKWVHMGRVNTVGRIRYAKAIGCDSVDGSKWSQWTDTYIEQAAHVDAPAQEMLRL